TAISEEDRASILNLTKQDGLYVLPTNKNIEGIWYNKQIFADLGLEVPETVDQFMEVCAAVKEAGIQPLSCAGKEQWPITRQIGAYATQAGGRDLRVKAINGVVSWSDPAFLEAYQWLIDMGTNGYLGEGVTTVDSDTQNSLFLTGAAAMEYNGSWFTENLSSEQNTLGEDVGFFAFPTVEGGLGVANTYTTSYGMYLCLKNDTYDEATGAWISYVMEHFGDKGMELHGWLCPYALQEEHEAGFFT
ncbi:MAG: extracellular solute-binding protein, partial [Blautia sp.]|nr:extracellular solute-binding protein [Blautia sp.]